MLEGGVAEEAPALEAVGPEQRVAPLRTELRALFQAALQAAYPAVEAQALVVASQLPQFADYQCNNAMALFGRLKGQVGSPLRATPPGPAAPVGPLPGSPVCVEEGGGR